MDASQPKIGQQTVVAIVCGASALPLAVALGDEVKLWFRGPEHILIPILVPAILAGLVIGFLTAKRTRTRRQPFAEASTKAGFLAALIAAALLVARETIHQGQAGHFAVHGFRALFIALVTILPATLLAMFAGSLARAVRLALLGDGAETAFRFRAVHLLYAACGFALLSPFIPGLLKAPPPPEKPVAAITPTPVPRALDETKREPSPPPSPSFKYEKPEGFDAAPANRITVSHVKLLDGVDLEQPALISPDGHKLAYHRRNKPFPLLAILDLDTFTELARIELGTEIDALAWSPDSSRLAAIFQTDDSRYMGIIYPEQRRVVALPRPPSPQISRGVLSWPDEKEVLIHAEEKKTLALNLDTLSLRTIDDAPFFRALSDSQKERVKVRPVAAAPKNANRALALEWSLNVAGPRWMEGEQVFLVGGQPRIVASDSAHAARVHLPHPDIRNAQVMFTPDGTKVVILHPQESAVLYLGLREAPKTVLRLNMRQKPEDFPQHEAIKKALSEKRLCAFIYAPLINPLNNAVIGADTSSLRALVRFQSWNATTAEVWMQDEFHPLEKDDVVSIFHTWEKRAFIPFNDGAAADWWTSVGTDGDAGLAGIPALASAPAVEFGPAIESESKTSGLVIQDERKATANKNEFVRPQNESAASSQLPPLPVAKPELQPARFSEKDVVNFINFHHQKSSSRDIAGMMNDYADRVEHYDVGIVDRAYIRAEEEKYHAPGFTIFERVRGQIRQTTLAPDKIRVEYPLQFVRVSPDASWTKGVSDVTLEIQAAMGGLRIVKQNSVSRENEKQKGRGQLPPL